MAVCRHARKVNLWFRLDDVADVNHVRTPVQNAGHHDIFAKVFLSLRLVIQVVPDLVDIVAQNESVAILRDNFARESSNRRFIAGRHTHKC